MTPTTDRALDRAVALDRLDRRRAVRRMRARRQHHRLILLIETRRAALCVS